jgi:hypothetical protein
VTGRVLFAGVKYRPCGAEARMSQVRDSDVGGRPTFTACGAPLRARDCQCAAWLALAQQVICEDLLPVEGPTAIVVEEAVS